MIGRFAQRGVYRELLQSWEFYRIALAGALALASYLWDHAAGSATAAGLTLAACSVALNGLPIVWGAVRGLLQRRINVDELVSLAIVASLVTGEVLTAAVVSFVMVLGAMIEAATSNSARKAIQALMTVAPETATLLVEGRERAVRVDEVRPGDTLLIRPGERIPVDAEVVKGITSVDESTMTGEPIPVEKGPGDAVFAGTLNQNGLLEARATKVGEDTTLGKVIKLVSEAESRKPDTIKVIDRYARWFTPSILACAAIAWIASGNVDRAVAVLIVGCPCALILAAPTAIVGALGRAARSGVLIKGGQFLEEAGRADAVLFDKTGTLTEGKPEVDHIVTVDGVAREDVLRLAASVEQGSKHPLARAVVNAARHAQLSVSRAEDMSTEIGLGVRARVDGRLVEVGSAYLGGGSINVPMPLKAHLDACKETGATPLVVYQDSRPMGLLSVTDPIRPAAQATVGGLRRLGIERVGILSGDHDKAARLIAEQAGVQEVWSELKPADKLAVIEQLQKARHTVMFVGDGINDAPALAAANVGIAMGAAGTDVALETADIALMHDDITRLPFLVRLGRKTLRVIKWNIGFGLAFNAFAVVAGGSGYLTPIMGAVVHNIGSVFVVLLAASLAFTAEDAA